MAAIHQTELLKTGNLHATKNPLLKLNPPYIGGLKYFNVVEALYIEEYKINLKFENGKTGLLILLNIFCKRDISTITISGENFKNFYCNYGTLT
jgi:hypothetical protein